ncbi:hypothetical protein [Streptomyces enissocaesilis]
MLVPTPVTRPEETGAAGETAAGLLQAVRLVLRDEAADRTPGGPR